MEARYIHALSMLKVYLICSTFQVTKFTPLLAASYENKTDVVELLIQHSAQLDITNNVR